MAAKRPENMSIEASLCELEALVAQLEHGELPLEDALKQFERGIGLVRSSQQKLELAQQKVSQLNAENGTFTLEAIDKSE